MQATLAHANAKMSERYANLSNERLQDTSDNLSSVVVWGYWGLIKEAGCCWLSCKVIDHCQE